MNGSPRVNVSAKQWARAEVGYRLGICHMRHPRVGDLYLDRNQLKVPHGRASGGQHVLPYRAESGSDSAKRLSISLPLSEQTRKSPKSMEIGGFRVWSR
jgi:hypothetical protein